MPCGWSAAWLCQATSTARAAEAAPEIVRKRATRAASAVATPHWKPSLAAISESAALPPPPPPPPPQEEDAEKRRGGVEKRRVRSSTIKGRRRTDDNNFRHYGVPVPPSVPSFPPTAFLF